MSSLGYLSKRNPECVRVLVDCGGEERNYLGQARDMLQCLETILNAGWVTTALQKQANANAPSLHWSALGVTQPSPDTHLNPQVHLSACQVQGLHHRLQPQNRTNISSTPLKG